MLVQDNVKVPQLSNDTIDDNVLFLVSVNPILLSYTLHTHSLIRYNICAYKIIFKGHTVLFFASPHKYL